MRLTIALLMITSGVVPALTLPHTDQGRSLASQETSGLQRRSPVQNKNKNKNKKSRPDTSKNSIPNGPANRETVVPDTPAQTTKTTRTSPASAPSKSQKQGPSNHQQSAPKTTNQNLEIESQKQEELRQQRRPRRARESSKSSPSIEPPTTPFRTRDRSPSPNFQLSEPGVRGEGIRQGQGGAQTPINSPPSPPRSPSPRLRSSSQPSSRPVTGSSTSRSRSSSAASPLAMSPPDSPPRARSFRIPLSSTSEQPSSPSRERGNTALSPGLARLLFPPGSPNIPAEARDSRPPGPDKFQNWLGSMRSMSEALKEFPASGKHPDWEDLREVSVTKAKAKQARALADRTRVAAVTLSDGQPAASSSTERAMRKSDKKARDAIAATREHTAALTAAVFSTKGTSENDKAVPYWESAARQWMRAQARETYRSAHAAEYNAKVMEEAAVSLPGTHPDRGAAFMRAAMAKKVACQDASQYKRCHGEYNAAKAEFPGGDSSDDEEWPLKELSRSSSRRTQQV